jgi:glycosyltransferase involved in cell wall biosynthesis
MHAVKDQRTLALAFVDMLQNVPGARARARLILVGDGPQRAAVEQVLREGDALSCAWFAGERADVPELLRGMDCFVLPSLAEGVSNTILEAMACGLPVIATRVGGNAELVRDQHTGVLVPPGDAAALARALNGYYALPQLAREHGHVGRDRVTRQFSLDYMVHRYQSLYTSLLGGRPVARGGLKTTST